MGLSRINYRPRMTLYLSKIRTFDKCKMVVVDVGARYGGEKHWKAYSDQVSIIGFEPDKEECKALNEKFGNQGHRYFPIALHRDKGTRPFYITYFSPASGFYKNDMQFWSRFPNQPSLEIKEIIQMETTDFDTFAASEKIEHVDFFKLDTEGAEMDILEGSAKTLRKGGVLGAAIEVRFSKTSGQPTFSDVDVFMRKMGFMLFDLEVYRFSRKALPQAVKDINQPTGRGQVFSGDALYLRDAAAEIETSGNSRWNDISILKLASIYELYGLPDCAIELLQTAANKNYLKELNIDDLINLLTPLINNKELKYQQYLDRVKSGKDENEPSILELISKDSRYIASRYLPGSIKRIISKRIISPED